jgi:Uncharacterized protein conserved in bacteria
MQNVLFEWDERKNLVNIKKHGISFQEARTCFEDEFAEVFPDTEHSAIEDRYILLGLSETHKTLVVIYTERDKKNDEQTILRIISARKATRKEFLYYWLHRKQKEQI